ncbi:hypothetical protein BDA99DRAFT_536598 [Phascolomyces articulosus]|uniref:Uncharacterized protein n=1 Tax=Phascolomyces articulosus TaxID=60185 RepID=A0AAD5K205_9FUNG|nr:hypothetical protein BDA99DRAFT_536598 [Phascolomyces articulosus]
MHFHAWLFQGLQDFLLQVIRSSTKLTNLTVVAPYNVNTLVNTLIDMQPLSYINISDPLHNSTTLHHLFKKYATDITTRQRITGQQQEIRSLESITLQHSSAISDDVLASLGEIKTLRRVGLQNLRSITMNGARQFIYQLSHQLVYIRFSEIKAINDLVIVCLADIYPLEIIIFSELINITDPGIRDLVDKKKSSKLVEMRIINCSAITENCLQYVKRKVKIFDSAYDR